MNEHLKKYQSHFSEIEGWASDKLFEIINFLDMVEINKSGGVMEIGVHHGKFFILLNQMNLSAHASYAIDLFDQQNLNIDESGKGSLTSFTDNLLKYDLHKGNNVKIISGDSTDPKLNLVDTIGKGAIRFVSIDGGHTVEHTINDLKIAAELINNQGVVILDDILNHHWLGVIEGAISYLNTSPTLIPFAIGHNKLFLAKVSYYNYYFEALARSSLATKKVHFLKHHLVAL